MHVDIYEYAFAWLGLGALYIVPAASLSAYANWHWIQRTKEEHDNRVLRFAAIAFGVGCMSCLECLRRRSLCAQTSAG